MLPLPLGIFQSNQVKDMIMTKEICETKLNKYVTAGKMSE